MAKTSDRVVLGVVHPHEVGAAFFQTSLMTLLRDQAVSRRVADVILENSSANISNARNRIVRQFLDKGVGEWLWFVDADMSLDADTLDRLLRAAHEKSHPIVGALCFGIHEHRLFPTLYEMRNDADGRPQTVRYNTFPPSGLMQVHATGAACLLVHRSVLVAIDEATDRRDPFTNPVYRWFQETALGDYPCGEDVTFCLRAGALGFPVHVDCSTPIGHQKACILTRDWYFDQLLLDAVKARPDVLELLQREPA